MHVDQGGGRIRYDLLGDSGAPLILVHALGVTGEMWWPQVEGFRDQFRVVTYHAAGHDQGVDLSGGFDGLAADLVALADGLGFLTFSVVGISLGGMIAQAAAAGYPQRVERLVLVSTTARYEEAQRRGLRDRAELVEREGVGAIVDATLERWFTPRFRETEPESVDRIRSLLLSADPPAYAETARLVAGVDLAERLGSIACPTLVLHGVADASLPVSMGQELARAIAEAQFEQIPDAAHLCTVEASSRVNGLLADFLSATGYEGEPTAPAAPW